MYVPFGEHKGKHVCNLDSLQLLQLKADKETDKFDNRYFMYALNDEIEERLKTKEKNNDWKKRK